MSHGAGAPGWHSDPYRRFDHRWFDGHNWTDDVASDGVQSVDRTDVATLAAGLGSATSSTAPHGLAASAPPTWFAPPALPSPPTPPAPPALPTVATPSASHPAGPLPPTTQHRSPWPPTGTTPSLPTSHPWSPTPEPKRGVGIAIAVAAALVAAVAAAGVTAAVVSSDDEPAEAGTTDDDPSAGEERTEPLGDRIADDPFFDVAPPSEPMPEHLAEMSIQFAWDMMTQQERDDACFTWEVAPELAKEAFLWGAEGDESLWPPMEQILRDEC